MGEVRPPWRGCRAKGRKSMPVSPGPFSCKHAHAHTPEHIHIHPEHKNSKLKWLFQPTLNFISVCFLVTWSDSKLFSLVFPFLKENIPYPKYGIHLHCNPKWSTDSFPLDLCFNYSHSLSFLMDNDWKHFPVGISTALFETDVLETTDKLPVTVRDSCNHSGPSCAGFLAPSSTTICKT